MLPESKTHVGLVSRVKGLLFETDLMPAPVAAPITDAAPASVADNAAYEALRSATLARPTEYSDFLAALNAIREVIVQEDMRFNTALAVMRSKGAMPVTLLRALDVHLTDLDTECTRFRDLAAAEMVAMVEKPRQACAELASSIAQRREEIARIESNIRQLETQQQTLERGAQTALERIAHAEQQITAASAALRQQLATDRARISTVQSN